ncbi:sensor histidine kinase [Cellulosimicrobium sp. PMB13]|uniref:sensor histidine kinase n=1 Tax=Cellulosimicrobium sp. PMB13 TaxID=3120158 RepID=UPI003F4B31D9
MGPLDRRRPRAFLALAVLAVSVVGTLGAAHGQPAARPLDAGGVALLAVSPLVLLLLLPRPVAAVPVAVGGVAVFLLAGYPWGPAIAGPVAVLAGVVLSGPVARGRRLAWAGAALLAGVVVAASAVRPDAPPPASLVGGTAWTAVVLLAAGAVRDRAARIAETRAADRAARVERERAAVADERLRIAREVHDVLAHSLSAITVQAGVGLHLLDRDPEQARSALTSIRATSTDALDEVRAVLGVVRAEPGDPDGRATAPPLAPTWDLGALGHLVRQAEAAGPDVDLHVDRAAHDLPDHLVGVVYRVVQESLTNVRRHAPAATRVEVRVATTAREVTVDVTDDGGPPPATVGPGHGLRGMRERLETVGGSLDAGPSPSGQGFRVRAVFPWAGRPARECATCEEAP